MSQKSILNEDDPSQLYEVTFTNVLNGYEKSSMSTFFSPWNVKYDPLMSKFWIWCYKASAEYRK